MPRVFRQSGVEDVGVPGKNGDGPPARGCPASHDELIGRAVILLPRRPERSGAGGKHRRKVLLPKPFGSDRLLRRNRVHLDIAAQKIPDVLANDLPRHKAELALRGPDADRGVEAVAHQTDNHAGLHKDLLQRRMALDLVDQTVIVPLGRWPVQRRVPRARDPRCPASQGIVRQRRVRQRDADDAFRPALVFVLVSAKAVGFDLDGLPGLREHLTIPGRGLRIVHAEDDAEGRGREPGRTAADGSAARLLIRSQRSRRRSVVRSLAVKNANTAACAEQHDQKLFHRSDHDRSPHRRGFSGRAGSSSRLDRARQTAASRAGRSERRGTVSLCDSAFPRTHTEKPA